MLLKLCDESFLFSFIHTKYFNILCYFIILFFVVLIFLTLNHKFIDKINKNFQKILIIVSFGLFVGFLIFLFILFLGNKTFNGCMTKYNMNIYNEITYKVKKLSNKLDGSKIIVVGDSRMELIENDVDLNIPFNFEFVAKSGMRIAWLKDDALDKVLDILEDNDYKYDVIVNMGVNDLNDDKYEGDDIADEYFDLYLKLAQDNPNVKVYILSVNPIDEELINEHWSTNNRTTSEIKTFNKTMLSRLKEEDIDNMFYCDSYNDLEFDTDDGLHYTQKTNQKIIDYIANKCVQF